MLLHGCVCVEELVAERAGDAARAVALEVFAEVALRREGAAAHRADAVVVRRAVRLPLRARAPSFLHHHLQKEGGEIAHAVWMRVCVRAVSDRQRKTNGVKGASAPSHLVNTCKGAGGQRSCKGACGEECVTVRDCTLACQRERGELQLHVGARALLLLHLRKGCVCVCVCVCV